MSEATRIAVRRHEQDVEVRLQMRHAMHNGREHDAAGLLLPAWYITELTVTLNDVVVLSAAFGVSVSRDPYLRFRLPDARVGDRLTVAWCDNLGEVRTDTAMVA
jgi:sulfur-oxidizing protein SoxZ